MQTETLPDAPTLPGLTLIEGIDMDAEVQCEDVNDDHAHTHPADLRVRIACGGCGSAPVRLYCRRAYGQLMAAAEAHHTVCGWMGDPHDCVTLIGYLR